MERHWVVTCNDALNIGYAGLEIADALCTKICLIRHNGKKTKRKKKVTYVKRPVLFFLT